MLMGINLGEGNAVCKGLVPPNTCLAIFFGASLKNVRLVCFNARRPFFGLFKGNQNFYTFRHLIFRFYQSKTKYAAT